MSRISRLLHCATAAAFLAGIMTLTAHGQIRTADQMTCEQAIQYYEQHGRIYVKAHGKNVVPVWLGKPVSKSSPMNCKGSNTGMQWYMLKTKDNNQCKVCSYCG